MHQATLSNTSWVDGTAHRLAEHAHHDWNPPRHQDQVSPTVGDRASNSSVICSARCYTLFTSEQSGLNCGPNHRSCGWGTRRGADAESVQVGARVRTM